MGRQKARRSIRSTITTDRADTLSAVLTLFAERDPDVLSFRHDVLSEKLLNTAAVHTWIDSQKSSVSRGRVPVGGWETLKYFIHGEQFTRSVPVAPSSALDRLRQLSERLVERFGWSAHHATVFVLTGEPVRTSRVNVLVSRRHSLIALSRITLTIDPGMTPREVAEAYAEVRNGFLHRRIRSQGKRSLELAQFFIKNCQSVTTWPQSKTKADETYERLRIDWNKQHRGKGNMIFRRTTNFATRCRQALDQLLMPDYGIGF